MKNKAPVAFLVVLGISYFVVQYFFDSPSSQETKHHVEMDSKKSEVDSSELTELSKFSLTHSSGKEMSSDDLLGKVWVASFVFTRCQSVCPLITKQMKFIQDEFLREDAVRLVSISVDPEYDTPERLRAYELNRGVNQDKWYFLTGNFSYIKDLLEKEFKIGSIDDPEFHTEKLVVVDKNLRIRGYFSAHSVEDLARLKKQVHFLISSNEEATPRG